MVDIDHLEARAVNEVLRQKGFVCEKCGAWEAVLYTNASLDEALRKLVRYPPGSRTFQYLFAKIMKRAKRIQDRGEVNGAFQLPNLASH